MYTSANFQLHMHKTLEVTTLQSSNIKKDWFVREN